MKKILIHFLLILSLLTVFTTLTYAQQQPISVIVNDTKIKFPDAQPFVDSNSRTQTPARFIAEELGATVAWNGEEQKATFKLGDKTLVLYIDDLNYTINDKLKQMDTTALLKDGRTYVPARYVAEAFGADVSWNSVKRTVYVSTKNIVTQNTVTKDTVTKDTVTKDIADTKGNTSATDNTGIKDSTNNTVSQELDTGKENTVAETPVSAHEPIHTALTYGNEENKACYFLKDINLISTSVGNNITEVYDVENGTYTITIPASLGVSISQEVLNINDSLVSTVEIKKDEETSDTYIIFNTKAEVRFYISYNEELNVTKINLSTPIKAELSYANKYDRVYFSLKGIKLASVGSTVTNYFAETYDSDKKTYTITLPANSNIFLSEEVFDINDSRVSTIEIIRDKETRDTHIIFNTKKEFKFYISNNEKLNQSEINLLTPAKTDEMLVVIDAGHGGIDPGACKGTTYEKDLNLAIALKLEKLLKAKNINTYMLRQDDTFVGLYDRPYIANALNATLFISIHNNAIDSTKVSGTETLYFPENEGDTSFTGEKFAKLIQDSLINKLKTVNRKTVERPNLVVLKYTKMPAALSEIGFLTNSTDLKNLKSEAFQQKTAEALCDAIVKSLEQLKLEKENSELSTEIN